jgi:AsmA protein
MRRVIVILAIAVVTLVILLVLGASLLNVDRFRPRVEAELQSKLDRAVKLGELHLHLFPFSIKADGLSIAEAANYPSPRPFATASEVFASADLMSLIKGAPQVKDLTLANPQIELIRNPEGAWNFSMLGHSAPSSSHQGGLTLDSLKITNGQLAVTDNRAKSPRTVYNHIDVSVTGFAPDKQFDFEADAHFPGQGKELLAFRGQAGPLGTGDQPTPVSGHVSMQQISLAGVNSVAPGTIPPNTDAEASGEGDLAWQSGTIGGKGNLHLDRLVVRGAKANYPVDTQYALQMNQKTSQLEISSATVKMGPTAVALSGKVDSGVTPANLNLRLQTQNASITELSRLASLFGAAVNANDQVKGSVSADLNVTGSAKSPDLNGNISASTIQAQDIVLSNVHATARMKNGVVELSPLTAGIFGGQEAGDISLDTKAAHPLCSIKTRFTGVDTNALLSAVSAVKDKLYGSLAADANLTFAIDAGANVARTLNGVLGVNVTNGQLKNVNILGELSRIGKFLNSAPAQSGSSTTLQKLAGTFNIANGVATTQNLVAEIPEGSLAGTGTLNLVNEGIDMRVNAVLASGASKTLGGTGAGGLLSTVLANNKGELVIPVLVTGSMEHPTFAPDVQAMTKMKFSHLLPTTADPAKAASGILGSILGGGAGGQAGSNGAQQQQQQNPLNSLFKALGKKKQ